MNLHTTLLLVLSGVLLLWLLSWSQKSPSREGYVDPIYIDPSELDRWYKKTNGDIYGFPHKYGGDWDILSGFPYYDRAY